MFSKNSVTKSSKEEPGQINWFEYGGYYRDYENGCYGLQIHSSTRFFEPATGKVWIPKKSRGVKVKICSDPEGFDGYEDGQILSFKNSKCDYLTNPLCSHLQIMIRKSKMKESRQSVWEFENVLNKRGIVVKADSNSKAKKIFDSYFATN